MTFKCILLRLLSKLKLLTWFESKCWFRNDSLRKMKLTKLHFNSPCIESNCTEYHKILLLISSDTLGLLCISVCPVWLETQQNTSDESHEINIDRASYAAVSVSYLGVFWYNKGNIHRCIKFLENSRKDHSC